MMRSSDFLLQCVQAAAPEPPPVPYELQHSSDVCKVRVYLRIFTAGTRREHRNDRDCDELLWWCSWSATAARRLLASPWTRGT